MGVLGAFPKAISGYLLPSFGKGSHLFGRFDWTSALSSAGEEFDALSRSVPAQQPESGPGRRGQPSPSYSGYR